MGKPTGFMEFPRQIVPYRDANERLGDFGEIFSQPEESRLQKQGARCMDCGVPFCQSATGCPIDNLIPEWNDLVYKGRWQEALESGKAPGVVLQATHAAALKIVKLTDLKKYALDLV